MSTEFSATAPKQFMNPLRNSTFLFSAQKAEVDSRLIKGRPVAIENLHQFCSTGDSLKGNAIDAPHL